MSPFILWSSCLTRRGRTRIQNAASSARVTSDHSGELGTNTSPEANSLIQSNPATWLNRSAQAEPCRLRAGIKHSTLQLGKPCASFFFFLFFFSLVEAHPSLLFKQHFQWEERLEESTGLSWGPLTKLHSAAKRNSACFPKNKYSLRLCKRTEKRSNAWREKAEIGRIPWGREKLPSLCNLPE